MFVAAFVAVLTAVAVFAFGVALGRIQPVLAVCINLVAVGGAAPTVWRWRSVLVVRWVVYGLGAGVGLGWIALILDMI